MEKIASCQITFTPIISKNYNNDINKVIDIIKKYNLQNSVNILSTTIVGNKEKIFSLIQEIYDTMDEVCDFTIDIKISNICGCK